MPGWLDFAESRSAAAEWRPESTAVGNDLLFCYFNSGTTAAPKVVRHSHVSWPVGHLSSLHWNGLRPGDRHLNLAAPGWAKHTWSSLFVPWTAEAIVVVAHDSLSTTDDLLRVLRGRAWTRCARHTRLREVTTVGEKLDPALVAEVDRRALARLHRVATRDPVESRLRP